jgi:hypothetical protein
MWFCQPFSCEGKFSLNPAMQQQTVRLKNPSRKNCATATAAAAQKFKFLSKTFPKYLWMTDWLDCHRKRFRFCCLTVNGGWLSRLITVLSSPLETDTHFLPLLAPCTHCTKIEKPSFVEYKNCSQISHPNKKKKMKSRKSMYQADGC